MRAKPILFLILLLGLAFRPTRAADPFPPDGFLPGWSGDVSQRCRTAQGLYDYMDGGAELYLEYRFMDLQAREYHHPDGADFTIEIWRFEAPEDAYGIFNLDMTGMVIGLGQEARSSDTTQAGAMRFWKGKNFVRLFAWQIAPGCAEALGKAARQVDSQLSETTHLPVWLTRLRESDLQPVFIRGRIALQQLAGALWPDNVPISRSTGAAWIRPSPMKSEAGCLVLCYDDSMRATQVFKQLWEQRSADVKNSVRGPQRGMIQRAEQDVEGLEQVLQHVLWVPRAPDDAACVSTLEAVRSALSRKEE